MMKAAMTNHRTDCSERMLWRIVVSIEISLGWRPTGPPERDPIGR